METTTELKDLSKMPAWFLNTSTGQAMLAELRSRVTATRAEQIRERKAIEDEAIKKIRALGPTIEAAEAELKKAQAVFNEATTRLGTLKQTRQHIADESRMRCEEIKRELIKTAPEAVIERRSKWYAESEQLRKTDPRVRTAEGGGWHGGRKFVSNLPSLRERLAALHEAIQATEDVVAITCASDAEAVKALDAIEANFPSADLVVEVDINGEPLSQPAGKQRRNHE